MKKIEFTIWDRFACLQVIGTLRGDLHLMRLGAGLMDKLELDEDEMEQAGVEQLNGAISWKGACDKVVELSEPEFSLLKRSVRDFQGWSVGAYDKLLALSEKLEIENG